MARASSKVKSAGNEARELVDLVVAYAKQETVDPLKGLVKRVIFGVIGAILLGAGVVFLALAILRVLQTEIDTFDGNLSWVPYFILTVVLLVFGLITFAAAGPGRVKKRAR